MKIVVIGGTGLIGSKTVERLRKKGHDVVAASPNSGVDTITGKGVAEALVGANVVVDLANSPSFEDKAVMEFFQTSGRNLLTAAAAAGVEHHIALSVVGTERLPGSGYMRAKMAQEELIRKSGIPYTIVHSTQFFEFMGSIAQSGTTGQSVHLSPAYVQPIASDDVADIMAEVALGKPVNGTIEIAGPDKVRLSEIVARFLKATNDSRIVVADPHAHYFGVELDDGSLVPGPGARLSRTHYDDWLPLNPPKKLSA
ncbi:SDR family oxidoreductase [Rhizobium giardinii]|uniref:SDR family oxidoreductase n=1 Tax=Rhizobium giardinii TaxID=56731 RepID=UPI000DDAF894